jgi:4a-hydroxytetrahydrobiopterin dehydratase
MKELKNEQCKPCEGYGQAFNATEIAAWLEKVPEWQYNSKKNSIYRRFKFKDFFRTVSFVNAVAWIANQQNHHPTLEVSYSYCLIKFTTHALNGLSPNDFICAAKVNELIF